MSKQIQDAYIVAAARTPVGRRAACSATPARTICWPTCCAGWWINVRGWTEIDR